MLLKLSKNAFVRQYGEFTYILERIKNFDLMFKDAEVFMRWIVREPMEERVILDKICKAYDGEDVNEITKDFREFVGSLVHDGIIITGEDEEELDKKDVSFSYEAENPKTMNIHHVNPSERSDDVIPQEVLEEYFRKHPTIFTLQIDVTQACTERCVHCYIPEYNPIFLPLKQIQAVIDDFRNQGGISLSLSGGECMLHPDFKDIVRYARSRDLIVEILSNLTLCDDSMIDFLKKTESVVQVSLYSMNATTHDAITQRTGSFAKTKTAIEKLRAANVPCLISCPTMKLNYRDYLDVLAYARTMRMDAQTDFVIMGKMNCDTSNLGCRLNLLETRAILEDIVFRSVPVNSEYFDPEKKDDLLTDDEDRKSVV